MNSGLSLAMNSANSDSTNSTRKNHNDQWPRRLALKLYQRRMLIGDNSKRIRGASPSGPAGSRSGVNAGSRAAGSRGPSMSSRMVVLSSTSDLPRLEIDARIDPGIGQVGNQIHDETDEGENVEIGEHHRIVAVEHAFEAEQAEAIEREYRLDQQRAGEEGADEGGRKAGDHQHHGVAEDVAVEHLGFRAALGARGEHILLAQFLEERVLGQERHGGERGKPHGNDRQGQVPEIVEDLLPQRKLRPAVRGQSAQRKNLEKRTAGEQDDEQDREQESGDGVADDDDAGGPGVERRAVAHRLADAERDRDQVAQQRHPDAERYRDRQLLLDQLDHGDVAKIALAEIEAQIVAEHDEKALIGRLVEAELLFQAFDEFRVEPLGAAIFRIDVALRALHAAARAEVAGGAGNARGRPGIAAGELRDDALHRPAGRELHHDERHQHDPENRGDHEQNAAEDVCGHFDPADICTELRARSQEAGQRAARYPGFTFFAVLPVSYHQVSGMPRE